MRNLVAENWRLERSRYAIVGSHCDGCNKYYFPSQQICLGCNSVDLNEHLFSGKGKLIEWTTIHDPAAGFELFTPLYYGIIELEEGIKISSQLTGIDKESKLKSGMGVSLVFRKLFEDGSQGVVTYGFKALPEF